MCNASRHFWKCPDCLTFCAVEGSCPTRLNCGYCSVPMTYMGAVQQDRLTKTEERCPCDDRCTNATGPNCNCKCGGINHGTQAVVTVSIDCGPVPVANVRPSAQTLWDLKEYRALRDVIRSEWKSIEDLKSHGYVPHDQYMRGRALIRALNHARTLTSHGGRMKTLRAVSKPGKVAAKPQQATLFE